jgi:hypothetical protein
LLVRVKIVPVGAVVVFAAEAGADLVETVTANAGVTIRSP